MVPYGAMTNIMGDIMKRCNVLHNDFSAQGIFSRTVAQLNSTELIIPHVTLSPLFKTIDPYIRTYLLSNTLKH